MAFLNKKNKFQTIVLFLRKCYWEIVRPFSQRTILCLWPWGNQYKKERVWKTCILLLTPSPLDATASPSSYPRHWVSEQASESTGPSQHYNTTTNLENNNKNNNKPRLLGSSPGWRWRRTFLVMLIKAKLVSPPNAFFPLSLFVNPPRLIRFSEETTTSPP